MKNELVICVNNNGYEVSLEKRKLYLKRKDSLAEQHGQIRVIDESGEDYLFPSACFVSIQLPSNVEQAILNAA